MARRGVVVVLSLWGKDSWFVAIVDRILFDVVGAGI